eukprot:1159659-Pelagomonas_calceolata.AAC.9
MVPHLRTPTGCFSCALALLMYRCADTLSHKSFRSMVPQLKNTHRMFFLRLGPPPSAGMPPLSAPPLCRALGCLSHVCR